MNGSSLKSFQWNTQSKCFKEDAGSFGHDASKKFLKKRAFRTRIAREVLVLQQGDEFIFPCADGTVKLAGKGQEVRTSHIPSPIRNPPDLG